MEVQVPDAICPEHHDQAGKPLRRTKSKISIKLNKQVMSKPTEFCGTMIRYLRDHFSTLYPYFLQLLLTVGASFDCIWKLITSSSRVKENERHARDILHRADVVHVRMRFSMSVLYETACRISMTPVWHFHIPLNLP